MTDACRNRLNPNEINAIDELKKIISEKHPKAQIFLYGSKARGDGRVFSDIDLLVLIDTPPNMYTAKSEIRDAAFELELKHDVVFGILVEDRKFWSSPLARAMPLHWNIDREGLAL